MVKELSKKEPKVEKTFETLSGIPLKAVYGPEDIKDFDYKALAACFDNCTARNFVFCHGIQRNCKRYLWTAVPTLDIFHWPLWTATNPFTWTATTEFKSVSRKCSASTFPHSF